MIEQNFLLRHSHGSLCGKAEAFRRKSSLMRKTCFRVAVRIGETLFNSLTVLALCLILAGCLAHPKYLESEYLWH